MKRPAHADWRGGPDHARLVEPANPSLADELARLKARRKRREFDVAA